MVYRGFPRVLVGSCGFSWAPMGLDGFPPFPRESVGIPAEDRGNCTKLPWARMGWVPPVPTGVRGDSRGIPWEFQISPTGSRGFPPFPRESVGIPVGNRGTTWESYIITVNSYVFPPLPRGSMGIPAGSRGTSWEWSIIPADSYIWVSEALTGVHWDSRGMPWKLYIVPWARTYRYVFSDVLPGGREDSRGRPWEL